MPTTDSQTIHSQAVFDYLQGLQSRIIELVELVDGKTFLHDGWQRPEGGGGNSCMLEDGNVFERAGIGFSHVLGNKLPPAASVAHPEAAGRQWEAMGVIAGVSSPKPLSSNRAYERAVLFGERR